MAVTIRLRQQGRHNRHFFRVVVADVRSPRDGKYIESIGWYNPLETELDKLLNLDSNRLKHWIEQGAIVSERVEALMTKGAPAVTKFCQEKAAARRKKIITKRTEKRKAAK